MHEASLHDANAFLTFTYRDEDLPEGGTLVKKHMQDFWKRYRKSIEPAKISYFQSGEYGEDLGRPHYHAIVFGHDFPDKKYWKPASDGSGHLFTSDKLERLWGKGFCSIGSVTFESAAYVARYALKKITGDEAPGWYQRLDPDTGELHELIPEYLVMSRNPAIGKRWFQRFGLEVFPQDEVIVRGHQAKPPRYYLEQQKRLEVGPLLPGDTRVSQSVKRARIETISSRKARTERGPERLRVRETVKRAQLQSLKRKL